MFLDTLSVAEQAEPGSVGQSTSPCSECVPRVPPPARGAAGAGISQGCKLISVAFGRETFYSSVSNMFLLLPKYWKKPLTFPMAQPRRMQLPSLSSSSLVMLYYCATHRQLLSCWKTFAVCMGSHLSNVKSVTKSHGFH